MPQDDSDTRIGALASALERAHDQIAELTRSVGTYRSLVENVRDLVWRTDANGRVLYVNGHVEEFLGYTQAEALGVAVDVYFAPDCALRVRQGLLASVFATPPAPWFDTEIEYRHKDGRQVLAEARISAERDGAGHVVALHGVSRDVSAHRRVEQALRHREFFLEESQRAAAIGSYRTDFVAGEWESSDVLDQIFGIDAGYARTVAGWLDIVHPDDRAAMGAYLQTEVIERRRPFDHEYRIVRKSDLASRWVHGRGKVAFDDRGKVVAMVGTIQDVTDRRLAGEERARLEAQLQQSQKMDSVGRLAGGVAHDFNNMLAVILGHTELAIEQLDTAHPLRADLEEIRSAAQRSAELTRQLLAFARKQTIAPAVIDLNEALGGMVKMLHRLIGEDIRLVWRPTAGLWPVKVDRSQLDQVLANLCVNARDAIASVGNLTIETANTTVGGGAARAGLAPGAYVRISVTDDGIGMDDETMSHIFEPFFTSKAVGKGTGLGLATVYGIVQQNDGFIDVTSALGQGTTFTIHLPRHLGADEPAPSPDGRPPAKRGRETILVVEDEAAILRLTKRMLEGLGYTVLAANTPSESLRLAREHAHPIDLLVTDVVMPEMNGRDLARALTSLHPGLGSLFMSGYTANVIEQHGVLAAGVHFVQKPFSKQELAARVREALDARASV